MAARQPDHTPRDERPRDEQPPKPTLMQSYSAFNDDHLRDIVGKIRDITRKAGGRQPDEPGEPGPPLPSDEEDSPLDQSLDQSIDQEIDHSLGHWTSESTIQSNDRSNERPNERPNEWSNERSIGKGDADDASGPPPRTLVLNENQAVLYHCLHRLQGRVTSLQRISQITGISAFTLKNCLRKLRKTNAVIYHGRQNSAGRIGFSADALPCSILLRGSEHRLRQRLDDINFERLPVARPMDPGQTHSLDQSDLMSGPMDGLMDTPFEPPCSSSIKKELLLQGLVFENSFANLNATSLLPFLGHIDSSETLQDFLDIANACVAAAAKSGSPIRNPKGFLFAQLKAGYINPPEGYKSRKVLAQETRNRQLEAELEDVRRLKEEEERLRLEVFRAKLTPAAQSQVLEEARARLDPRSPLSEGLQLEMAQAEVLRSWMEASRGIDTLPPL